MLSGQNMMTNKPTFRELIQNKKLSKKKKRKEKDISDNEESENGNWLFILQLCKQAKHNNTSLCSYYMIYILQNIHIVTWMKLPVKRVLLWMTMKSLLKLNMRRCYQRIYHQKRVIKKQRKSQRERNPGRAVLVQLYNSIQLIIM